MICLQRTEAKWPATGLCCRGPRRISALLNWLPHRAKGDCSSGFKALSSPSQPVATNSAQPDNPPMSPEQKTATEARGSVPGRRYKNAPIVEAVCEFRFDSTGNWDQTIPGLIFSHLDKQFPKRRTVSVVESTIQGTPEGVQSQLRREERVQFLRDDERAFVQVGQHLLAINHLQPYPTWHEYRPLIEAALNVYREVASPTGIQRIGLRYINRIKFPHPRVDIENYFNFYPFIGEKLPTDYTSFVCGVQFPFENLRDVLRLQVASVQDNPDISAEVALDLDYFLAKPREVAIDSVFTWLDKAHSRVDDVFEGCLTDALRELFEGGPLNAIR
jgi:uncharacterized protein (TIGR04255 family)